MVIIVLIILVGPTACGVIDSIDVCKCVTQEGSFVCVLQRGARLTASECDGTSLRTTGPGFVTGMQRDILSKFGSIVVERSTLSCDILATTSNVTRLIVDGAVCVVPTTNTTISTTTTTTTTIKMMPTKETKPRPPAHPIPNDDDEGGDDGDDDNDDAYDDDDDSGTTTSTSTNTDSSTTTAPPTTTTLTTRPMITIAASVTLRDGILLGVGIVIACAGVIVVVRVTILRRRRRSASYPVQVNEVTSTDDQPQRTYVIRQVPRSPRRRGTDSMESVTLFAVDDHEL